MPPTNVISGRLPRTGPGSGVGVGNSLPVEVRRFGGSAIGQLNQVMTFVGKSLGGVGGGANSVIPAAKNAGNNLGSLAARLKQFSFAALTAATGFGAAMLSTQQHFSPATYHMFQLRLGDLAAVVGSVLHPAFESLSNTVYSTSRFLYNLSPAMKGLLNFFAQLSIPVLLLSVGLPGLSWAIRGVWRSVVAAVAGINAASASLGVGGGARGFISGGVASLGIGGAAIAGGGAAYALGGNRGQIAGAAVGTAAAAAAISGSVVTGVGMATGSIVAATATAWALPIMAVAALGDAILNRGRGAEWLGKKTGLFGSTDMDPTGLDAARKVTTLNSVLEAGQMFRAGSLMDTQKASVADIVAERDRFNETRSDMPNATLGDAALRLVNGEFLGDLRILLQEFFTAPSARRIS